jgi:hypothetical protein
LILLRVIWLKHVPNVLIGSDSLHTNMSSLCWALWCFWRNLFCYTKVGGWTPRYRVLTATEVNFTLCSRNSEQPEDWHISYLGL